MTKIIWTHGQYNLERASITLAVANDAIALDAEVVVFLQVEVVNVVIKDFYKDWVFSPFTPIQGLIDTFVEFGKKCTPVFRAWTRDISMLRSLVMELK